MTAPLDPRTADKLAKLCGLFSSHHDGERASAADKADKLLRQHGLTWQQIILPSQLPESVTEKIAFALANIGALSMWERGFIYTVRGKCCLSPEQLELLDHIVDKARTYGAEGGRAC